MNTPERVGHGDRAGPPSGRAACDVVAWTNDLFSSEKERSLDEGHNLVWVLRHHRRMDEQPALTYVHRLDRCRDSSTRRCRSPSGSRSGFDPSEYLEHVLAHDDVRRPDHGTIRTGRAKSVGSRAPATREMVH